jgi:hypothetical protein
MLLLLLLLLISIPVRCRRSVVQRDSPRLQRQSRGQIKSSRMNRLKTRHMA